MNPMLENTHHITKARMGGPGAEQPRGVLARPAGQAERDRVQPGVRPGLGDTRLTSHQGKNTLF